jgi:ADP-L-glycero-D-manno-heptose 6-epimerase
MIVVTGAAGFIGSVVASCIQAEFKVEIVLVDDFQRPEKLNNHKHFTNAIKVDRDEFPDWIMTHGRAVDFVIHLGARTDTTEFDTSVFDKLNLNYSKKVWELCSSFGIPLIYASSAATYGMGESGYSDNHQIVGQLKPLNPYGISKNEFDKWALTQLDQPPYWAGLKFFNVYGPNEYHKGRMASVIFHAFRQIKETGKVKLFRSHHHDFTDGGQLRDFVYVKDVAAVIMFLIKNKPYNGLYNLGTGKARTFRDLAESTFIAMDKEPLIEFVDTPLDIRDKYQYFTEADMTKLKQAGYTAPFTSLEEGVRDYVVNYLNKNQNFL